MKEVISLLEHVSTYVLYSKELKFDGVYVRYLIVSLESDLEYIFTLIEVSTGIDYNKNVYLQFILESVEWVIRIADYLFQQ